MDFTAAQFECYIRNNGRCCPNCDGEHIEVVFTDVRGLQWKSEVHCHDCGMVWQDIFKLETIVKINKVKGE